MRRRQADLLVGISSGPDGNALNHEHSSVRTPLPAARIHANVVGTWKCLQVGSGGESQWHFLSESAPRLEREESSASGKSRGTTA